MKKLNRISIIGVGLIGGSIGLAVKKAGLKAEVVGLTTRRSSLNKALKKKAIDKGTLSLDKAVNDADLVIIAAPAARVVDIFKKIKPGLKEGAVVTDAASTKKEIVSGIDRLSGSKVCFVGSHPMAGSEKRGVEFARADLFTDSICIITPTSKTDKKAVSLIKRFWCKLGAKCLELAPGEHDEVVARVSHLPHLVAVSLIRQLREKDLKFASSGFKDTTRIAEAAENIWADICLTNKTQIIKAIDAHINILTALKKHIRQNRTSLIKQAFAAAGKIRKRIKK